MHYFLIRFHFWRRIFRNGERYEHRLMSNSSTNAKNGNKKHQYKFLFVSVCFENSARLYSPAIQTSWRTSTRRRLRPGALPRCGTVPGTRRSSLPAWSIGSRKDESSQPACSIINNTSIWICGINARAWNSKLPLWVYSFCQSFSTFMRWLNTYCVRPITHESFKKLKKVSSYKPRRAKNVFKKYQ